MGFEVKLIYHPRKEDGGYDTETRSEKLLKVGKPFDETPLEKLAGAIMVQLARRDVWVVDVEVVELVKRQLSFKETADGKGIVLKNKRYAFNSSAELVADDLVEEPVREPHEIIQPEPHERLYQNANASAPVRHTSIAPVNQKRALYHVIFEPYVYEVEAQRLKLKLTPEKKYPVHQIIPSPTGNLERQRIVITDDTGKAITVDEKFFTTAGAGLLGDNELDFSGRHEPRSQRPKLMYDGDAIDGDLPAYLNDGFDVRRR